MPNWVKNHVLIMDRQAIKDCIKTEHRQGKGWEEDVEFFDFNEIIPMPEELKDKTRTYPSWEAEEKQDKELVAKYGADNWYDWSVKNWGTKWNTDSVRKVSPQVVEFDTAWATPEPLIKALSEKYHTTVSVCYADEDLGSNCGEYEYKDGEKVLDEVGDYDFACEVWGFDPEENN